MSPSSQTLVLLGISQLFDLECPGCSSLVVVWHLIVVFLLVVFHPLLALLLCGYEMVRCCYFGFRLCWVIKQPPREAEYGRLLTQNYLRRNGQNTSVQENPDDPHILVDQYPMFPPGLTWKTVKTLEWKEREQLETSSAWKTEQDKTWLKKEKLYRQTLQQWTESKRGLRACLKALVPVIGLLWVAVTETSVGGGSVLFCQCLGGQDDHWTSLEAINFHLAS